MHIGQRLKIKKRRKMGTTSKSSRKKKRWSRATSKHHAGLRLSSQFGVAMGPCKTPKKTESGGTKMYAWVIKAIKEQENGNPLEHSSIS